MQDAVEKPVTDEIPKGKNYKDKSAPITSAMLLLQALAAQDVASALNKIARALEKQNQSQRRPNLNQGGQGFPGGNGGRQPNPDDGDESDGLPWSYGYGNLFSALGLDDQETAFIGSIIEKTKETMDIWLPWKYTIENIYCGKRPAGFEVTYLIKLVNLYHKYKPLIEKLLPLILDQLVPLATSGYSPQQKTTNSASLAEHFPEAAGIVRLISNALYEPTLVLATTTGREPCESSDPVLSTDAPEEQSAHELDVRFEGPVTEAPHVCPYEKGNQPSATPVVERARTGHVEHTRSAGYRA